MPDAFPEVEAKTHEELLSLLTEEAAFQGLVRDIMARSDVSQLAADMRAGNLSLAQANLAKEDELRELRNQIAIIRSVFVLVCLRVCGFACTCLLHACDLAGLVCIVVLPE